MKELSAFSGFTPQTFQFLKELEENNYKPWFEEHKLVYQLEVLLPLRALAAAMGPSFYQVDPQMELRPQKMLSRIYRDIRFSPDKTPYKSHMWVMFQRPFTKLSNDWASFPGYYLEIDKDGVSYGMGLFDAGKKIMDRYREQVTYDPGAFRELIDGLVEKKGFVIGGESYKRPLKSDLPEFFQPWIQRKGIYLTKRLPVDKRLLSADFIPFLEQEFAYLHPLYDFFVDICD